MDQEQKCFSEDNQQEILNRLKTRFEAHMERHQGVRWEEIESKIADKVAILKTLYAMEASGGEPDIIYRGDIKEQYLFMDCSAESPKGRRKVCYDREALDARKKNKPDHNALDMALSMGIVLLTEKQYRTLQQCGQYDTKTSSWIKTPERIRARGGAIFGDRRYDTVFIYHNGADSYYSSRGFRGAIKV